MSDPQIPSVPEPQQAAPAPNPAPQSEAAPQPTAAQPSHPFPVLPRGSSMFDNLPARAVVLEELAPALHDGVLVIKHPKAVGVVLVRDDKLFEHFCFLESGERRVGAPALAEIKSWQEAGVSAFRFNANVVDAMPTHLRGAPIYYDLRLGWSDWSQLLSDLMERKGTFAVELHTPNDRGVTLISNGERIATFTDEHSELGDPSLLDSVAAGRIGTVFVRAEPTEKVAPVTVKVEAPPPATDDAKNPLLQVPGTVAPPVATPVAPPAAPPVADPAGNAFGALFSGAATDAVAPTPAPQSNGGGNGVHHLEQLQVNVSDMLPDLKLIARNRLQRSAARVEAMLDEAAQQGQPLEVVLGEIRGLVIRGVMQSTLDEVADEMTAMATARATT